METNELNKIIEDAVNRGYILGLEHAIFFFNKKYTDEEIKEYITKERKKYNIVLKSDVK